MLSSTASTHVMVRQNDVFSWLTDMPVEQRDLYIRMSGPIARRMHEEQKAETKRMKAARAEKAKAEQAHAAAGREKTKEKAAAKRWSEADMELALKTDGGKPRAENAQKTILCSQLTTLFSVGELTKPKGFSKNKWALADMKSMLLTCIRSRPPSSASSSAPSAPQDASGTESDADSDGGTPLAGLAAAAKISGPPKPRAQRVYADISSLSGVPDVEEVVSGALDPDFDAVGSDSDDEASTLPCCGVKWDEDVGFAVVKCNRCCEWFHKGPLGACPGQELTRKKLGTSFFGYFCRECLVTEA